ncbi:MAG: 50S ribosomal protein L25 [Acidobacteria bacterium]|nr:50S ribosomal protein L25 [Acidobacteriota bacterium]
MKTSITVPADVRVSRGKNEARRTRRDGKIPAVVYGAFKDPVSIAVDPRQIVAIIRSATGYNTIFDLDINGHEKTPVMVVDQQTDPLKGNLLHADFKRIDLTKRIRVSVPVVTEGEPKGVKVQGGHFELVNRSLEIECLPGEIPEQFSLDVSELMIGQSVRAGDVQLSGSMHLTSPADSVIAHVVALKAEEAPAAAPAAEGAATPAAGSEPEVIKKGKKEEEAEAEKGKKK